MVRPSVAFPLTGTRIFFASSIAPPIGAWRRSEAPARVALAREWQDGRRPGILAPVAGPSQRPRFACAATQLWTLGQVRAEAAVHRAALLPCPLTTCRI